MVRLRVVAGVVGLSLAGGVLFTGSAALAEGDPAKGQRVFRQCQACHVMQEGMHRVGPSLHGVFGRQAGVVEGFRFSKPHADAGTNGLVWTEEVMFDYLENPRRYIPGNRMAFAGLRRPQDRLDVIAYIRENGGAAAE